MDNGSLTVAFDHERGIIHGIGRGHWTMAQVDAYFSSLRHYAVSMRRRSGVALLLVDLTEAPVQALDIAARIKTHSDMLYVPGDRFAAVLDSSLSKLELRKSIELPYVELFVSENAALTWINAYRFGHHAPANVNSASSRPAYSVQ